MFDSVLNTSVSVTAQYIQWPYAMYYIRHVQNNSGIFSTVFFQVLVGMFSHSALLRHIHSYWDIIKGYSAPCITPTYSKLCHILSPILRRNECLFKTLWNVEQTNSEPCHSASFGHIHRHIENLVRRLHMQKPDIFGILGIFRTLP